MTIIISLEVSERLELANPDKGPKEFAYIVTDLLERFGFDVVEINVVEEEEKKEF